MQPPQQLDALPVAISNEPNPTPKKGRLAAVKDAYNDAKDTLNDAKDFTMENPWRVARYIDYAFKIAVFITYACLGISLLGYIGNTRQCYVQHTYRQDFAANIVSNPLYSSANVVFRPPLSKLERVYYNDDYNTIGYQQNVSTIIVLPNQVDNAPGRAAFLSVLPMPQTINAAQETIPIQRTLPGAYYYDPAFSGKIKQIGNDGVQATVAERTATFDAMKSAISAGYRHDLIRPGTQMPNMGRCTRLVVDSDSTDVGKVNERLQELRNLQNNTHRLGACLLTGLQATVDVTSNYSTSMILFSSVNVVFMVALILWISASFALFHVGGGYKTWAEIEDPVSEAAMKGEAAVRCCETCCTKNTCSCCTATCGGILDDVFLFLAIVWNLVPALLLMSRDIRTEMSVPLNNALLGIAALLVTILLQWKWANFHAFDTATHEMVARRVFQMQKEQDDRRSNMRDAAVDAPKKSAVDLGTDPVMKMSRTSSTRSSSDSRSRTDLSQAPTVVAEGSRLNVMFDVTHFLSSSSSPNGGAKYMQLSSVSETGSPSDDGGLRMRRATTAQNQYHHSVKVPAYNSEERSYFSSPYGKKSQRRALVHSSAAMPSYAQLIRTGSPIVQYNYVNIIRKEMLLDSAQAIEYAITTPILFATLLAASSPTVSTGMVQWAYGSLLASHLLVVPLMYLGHYYSTHAKDKKQEVRDQLLASIGVMLAACATFQFIGLLISLSFIANAYSFYGDKTASIPMTVGVVLLQLLYVVFVVVDVFLNIFVPSWVPNVEWFMSTMYTIFDVCMKMILAYVLAVHAEKKQFPVLTCSVWDGPYEI